MNLREPYLDLRNSKSWYVYLYSKLCNHNGQRVNETYLMNDRELLTVYRFHKKQNTFFFKQSIPICCGFCSNKHVGL